MAMTKGKAHTRSKARLVLLLSLLPLSLGGVCEGDGFGTPVVVSQAPLDPRCTAVSDPYPSGFDLLPDRPGVGLVMQFRPAVLLAFDLDHAPPRILSPPITPPLPSDSDGDGVADSLRYSQLGLCPVPNPLSCPAPSPGSVNAIDSALALVASSGYEQVLFYEPLSARLRWLDVYNPPASASRAPQDDPLLPVGGQNAPRTALSTRKCVYPADPTDSLGDPIPGHPLCDPGRTGFLTRFTAASVVVDGRLFVATSNLEAPSLPRFNPGTVLIYDIDLAADPPRIGPDPDRPAVFTSSFNPTGLTAHRTASGRALVLVTQTGPIDSSGTLLGPGAVDVIDVVTRRLAATIPLGDAGPSFGPVAIDPSGRVALLGAESNRHVYAIDLAPLEDPALYPPGPAPVVLDGSDPGFADARIFDAQSPLILPDRTGGPPLATCPPRTNVAINHPGDLAYATDWCDATLTIIELDLDGAPPVPVPGDRFRITTSSALMAPKTPRNFGRPTAPSMIRVRPGVPGNDYSGRDVFFIANEPEGQLCGIRVDS
jgi:hypothetical protein